MKKIISYILLMALCLSLLVGCQEAPATNTEPTTAPTTAPTDPTLDAKEGLEKAKTYLYNLYKDSAEKTVKSFDVVAIVNMQEYGIYNVTWTVDNEAITFAPSEKSDKMITVVIPSPDAEIAYKLTATISDGKGNSATVEFNHIVPASIGMIVNPVPGVPYKMSMFHGNHGKDLYFIGKARDSQPWYMTSSDYIDEAIDVYLEEVTGGLRLYFFVDDVKTYLDMHKDGTHYSLRLTTTPTAVYTWNTEYNTLVAQVEDKQCFIGTSGTASYYTFSCNKIDTIANDFVAHLYGAGGIVVEPEQPSQPDPTDPVNPNEPTIPPVTSPVAGTTYKFGMYQKTNGHTVYIAGGIDQDRYLITTTDKAAALDVTVEASGNGFKFAVTINGTKLYITAGTNSAGKVALSYTAEGSVFTYDATISAWCTDVNGTVNYIGSYSNFDTMSLSKTSYISADNKGVTQFPAGLYEAN